ncbi:MAG TPA: Lrp/AsnC family transcriptional regulator [Nordella sp.]|nr:Lrp/AsnC family transcriptional regulator [Nordella sp.]
MAIELDDLDRRILDKLQKDNRLSTGELAEQVNSSAPTCLRRVKRLRDEGVIIGDVCVVDPSAIGRRMTMIVEVTLERERPEIVELFKQAVQSCEQISLCYYVTGDVDFVLIVHVADMEEYEGIIDRIFHQNRNIKWFKTLISIRRIKHSSHLPVI